MIPLDGTHSIKIGWPIGDSLLILLLAIIING